MRVAVVGAGYVGLVSGACFADFGHVVTCVDVDASKIDRLKGGEAPIYEPGLEALMAANVAGNRLTFSTEVEAAITQAEVVMIAVGTPSRRSDGHADLSYIYSVAAAISRAIRNYTVVVIKSTVPVGTGNEVERIIGMGQPATNFSVVSNPEFLREGAAIHDFKHPDRIVVGAEDQRARTVMAELYRPLFLNAAPIFFVSRRTSEVIKYASNSFLAMKISFINELADLCEVVDANVQDVAHGVGLDNRIGRKFLNAGPGYGGSCFPKDTLALIKTARDHGVALSLVEATVSFNDNRKRAMARKVIKECGGSVRGKKIAVLGLTYKPNTDDTREAPALSIIQALQDHGARVSAYDPNGMKEASAALTEVEFREDAYSVAEDASALVIVTEWDQFRSLDLERLGSLMSERVLIDLRNIYRPHEARRHGFHYVSIGRPDSASTGQMLMAAE